MKSRHKKPKHVRERDWGNKHEFAFSRDLARHRKGAVVSPDPLPDVDIRPEDIVPNGLVIAHSGQYAFVLIDGREVMCLIHEAIGGRTSTVLASGDEVLVTFETNPPMVQAAAPRRTKLSRLAHVHSEVAEQIIAANAEILVIVASAAKPRFKPGLVDRYMIAAQVGKVNPLLVLNKMDLVSDEPVEIRMYRDLGLPVIATSCVDGRGLAELRDWLRGKLSVLSGHSGVGKSSLLNALDTSLDIETAEVSTSNDKGRHTTAQSTLHCIEGDIRIIDTPGVRNLGIWNVTAEEVAFYFPEMVEIAIQCRFSNCTHTHEPDCAVRKAVEAGSISRLRYESYLRIRASL